MFVGVVEIVYGVVVVVCKYEFFVGIGGVWEYVVVVLIVLYVFFGFCEVLNEVCVGFGV